MFHVDGEQLRTRVIQLAAGTPGERNRRSPALHTALGRAQGEAGDAAVTTGQLLVAIAADPDSQGAKVLERAGVSEGALAAALREVPVQGTSDAAGTPRWFEIRVGGRSATVEDEELAALLRVQPRADPPAAAPGHELRTDEVRAAGGQERHSAHTPKISTVCVTSL